MVLTSHWDFFSTSHTRAQTHGSNYFDARPHYWAEFHHSFDKRPLLISYVPRRHFPGAFRPIGIFLFRITSLRTRDRVLAPPQIRLGDPRNSLFGPPVCVCVCVQLPACALGRAR